VSQGSIKSLKQGDNYYNPAPLGNEGAVYKSQPKTKNKMNMKGYVLKTNATELDLGEGDGAGSRVPGGDTLIANINGA